MENYNRILEEFILYKTTWEDNPDNCTEELVSKTTVTNRAEMAQLMVEEGESVGRVISVTGLSACAIADL